MEIEKQNEIEYFIQGYLLSAHARKTKIISNLA